MIHSFPNLLALSAILLWPVIPLFWIPVHCVPRFFRKLGFLTYLLAVLAWIPVAYFMYASRDALLSHRLTLLLPFNIVGVLLFLGGAGLQIWTFKLLTGPVITGMPEVTDTVQSKLMTQGPFGVIRHPTYLSHTMMFLGLFLWTEVVTMAVVTALDLILVLLVIIPLEERELLERFGREYEEYRTQIPARLFPRLLKKHRNPNQ
jgi:protein-S-isoprenylcysteine O-methyltransferase Ste14